MTDTLVLGGNGFLGSYLVDALVEGGHRVSVLDRFSSGNHRFETSQASAIIGSIDDPTAVADAMTGQHTVFYFAGSTTPVSSLEDPSAVVRGEVEGIVPVLDAAVRAGVRRVVFASTGGAIYGEASSDTPVTEETAPSPISPYGIGKLAVEGFLRFFTIAHGLDTISLRISNPYGSRQRVDRRQGLIPIVLQRISENRPIGVYGNGLMVRDYVFAPDVARAAASLAEADHLFPVYNVGSGIGHSVRHVIDVVAQVTGRRLDIEQLAPVVGFVERSVLDVGRFESEFGLISRVDLRRGVDLTWSELQGRRS